MTPTEQRKEFVAKTMSNLNLVLTEITHLKTTLRDTEQEVVVDIICGHGADVAVQIAEDFQMFLRHRQKFMEYLQSPRHTNPVERLEPAVHLDESILKEIQDVQEKLTYEITRNYDEFIKTTIKRLCIEQGLDGDIKYWTLWPADLNKQTLHYKGEAMGIFTHSNQFDFNSNKANIIIKFIPRPRLCKP